MAATNNASTALYTSKRFDNFTVNESTTDNFSSAAIFDRITDIEPVATITDLAAIAPLNTENWHAGTITTNHLTPSTVTTTITSPISNKKSRWQWGFHIAPSISYRLLVDENYKSFFPGNYIASPIGLNYDIDVNQVVKHRPAMGIEVGLSFAYQLNERISLTSGFQFNMRQYNIEAFGNNFENAPIALNNNYGQAQVINTTSRYRTSIGTMPIVLQNKYQEISIPIGIRWQVLAAKQFGISVGGSVQPTYVFDKAPFVITTDYKNYADGKSLMRNWNVNTNVEALFSYRTNSITWIAGPQVRYQQLPTFSYRYPIREHLVDYGFKIGFLQQLK
jgi:long-subunit fatty acid transport protein